MRQNWSLRIGVLFTAGLTASGVVWADELTLIRFEPASGLMNAEPTAAIRLEFDRPVKRNSVTNNPTAFWAFGRWSGTALGTIDFEAGDTVVVLRPERAFSSGELVTVTLSKALRAADGSKFRATGYSWQFMTRARRSTADFQEVQRMTTRTTQGQTTRAYGGFATDLDRDGYLDLTVVNEDTADLRVFINKADRSTTFHPFAVPPYSVGNRASPSEVSDFNLDGWADVAVADIDDNTLSLLLGDGQGGFMPRQTVNVGFAPRGVAILDVDGDGDVDVVNTNSTSSNLSLLINDGQGVFAAPVYFDGGGTGEWALGAADMNEDGLLDLVVGSRGSREITVLVNNGNQTFQLVGRRPSGGQTWQIATGDVNGDGHFDVACANSQNNNGSILLGDGSGGVGVAQVYATDPFPLATDVGDMDGDGDLDWVNSSYAGDWLYYENNGAGVFTQTKRFNAPQSASCATLFDGDNDGDLEMALIDELEDVVIVFRNSGLANRPGDANGDCKIDLEDHKILAGCLAGPADCASSACWVMDLNNDCKVDLADVAEFQRRFTGPEQIPGCP